LLRDDQSREKREHDLIVASAREVWRTRKETSGRGKNSEIEVGVRGEPKNIGSAMR
jgi:hypothetical protein